MRLRSICTGYLQRYVQIKKMKNNMTEIKWSWDHPKLSLRKDSKYLLLIQEISTLKLQRIIVKRKELTFAYGVCDAET